MNPKPRRGPSKNTKNNFRKLSCLTYHITICCTHKYISTDLKNDLFIMHICMLWLHDAVPVFKQDRSVRNFQTILFTSTGFSSIAKCPASLIMWKQSSGISKNDFSFSQFSNEKTPSPSPQIRVVAMPDPDKTRLASSSHFSQTSCLEQSVPMTFITYIRLLSDMEFSNCIRAGSVVGVKRAALEADRASGLNHSERQIMSVEWQMGCMINLRPWL